jgi:hypothetical protein
MAETSEPMALSEAMALVRSLMRVVVRSGAVLVFRQRSRRMSSALGAQSKSYRCCWIARLTWKSAAGWCISARRLRELFLGS